MDKALLDKIEKIINLQDRAGTIAEASAAAAALQRIMTQHNLEMADVQRRLGGKAPATNVKAVTFDCPSANWMRKLFDVVANANQATCFFRRGTITVIAHEGKHNAIADVANALIKKANAMSSKAYAEYIDKRDGRWHEPSRSWTNSYKWGFVSGVRIAMDEAARETAESFSGGSALVLVQKQEVDSYASKNYSLRQSRVTINGGGYESGKSDGYHAAGSRGKLSG